MAKPIADDWVDLKPEDQTDDWQDIDTGVATTTREPIFGEKYIRAAAGALPVAGGLLGGVAGTALGPAGTLGGGALGAAGGKAAQNYVEGLLGDNKPIERLAVEPIQEAAWDVGTLGAGQAIAKSAKAVAAPIGKYIGRFAQPQKEIANEIVQSAERLGTKTTPGMLTENKLIGGIESSMSQSPTKTGQAVGDSYENISNILKGKAEGLISGGKSAPSSLQLGSKAKSDIVTDLSEKLAPAQMIYDDIAKEGRNIDVGDISRSRISNNIRNIDAAKIKGTPEASFANMVSDNLEGNVKSLKDLRNLKTYVGKMTSDMNASPQMRSAAGDVYGRLAQLEKNSITRSAIEAGKNPQHGKAVAREMISELKDANKIYSNVSKEVQDLAEKSGLGKVRNYADFISKIEAMPDEQFVQRMFKQGNNAQLKTLEKQFPKAYDSLKTSYMSDMYNKSVVKGEVSVPKLLSNAKKLPAETQELLFGPGSSQTIKDIENVYNAFPQKMGPSGTPQGIEFAELNLVSPKFWFKELRDKANDLVIKNPDLVQRMSSALQKPSIPLSPQEQAKGLLKSRVRYQAPVGAARGLLDE